jgi:hypothetical protein
MPKEPDFYRLITGEDFDAATRLPEFGETFSRLTKQLSSAYPLRELGTGTETLYISEEERSANFHIIGAPGEGKSKFIEYHIRKDIDEGKREDLRKR